MDAPGLSPRTTELWRELDLLMTFHERVESRFALLFGVDAALIGALANVTPPLHQLTAFRASMVVVALSVISVSVFRIYRGLFPRLGGPMNSMLYFRSISAYNEEDYASEWRTLVSTQLVDDLSRQVWRNARLVTEKFRNLRSAFSLTIFALAPWALSVAIFTWGEAATKPLTYR